MHPSDRVMEKVVVGMSGGVDSAVSAWLLKEQGYDVVGLFMKNWEDDDNGEYCTSRQDLIDASSVADLIGIDLQAVNFAKEYKERVFSIFLREYEAGRTPNPDVLCNSEIKFRAFLDHAVNMGADSIAKKIGLPVAEKKDSTGICFIGERPFREFLERYLPTKEGEIRTPDGTPEGRVIGKHIGLAFYTIGQRKGIGIGGCRDSEEKPWFVAKKDIRTNTLWVVQGHDHPWLLGDHLFADSPSWISGHAPEAGSKLGVKTRYRQADCPATLASVDGEQFAVKFDEPQWAVTPGQSAVLYDGEVCLGGGFIEGLSNGQAR